MVSRLETDRAAALEASRVSQAEAKRENAKHTPGPWEWWTSCSYRRLSSRATRNDGDVLHATVQKSDGHPDIHFPNGGVTGPDARLIAAAPDLLEALQSVWLWVENQSDAQSKGGHETFDLMMLREQRDIARAAIARATGEQP